MYQDSVATLFAMSDSEHCIADKTLFNVNVT